MAFNWDTSSPGDSAIVSTFPSNERDFRAAARGAFAVDHDPDTNGYHDKVTLNQVSEPTGVASKWTMWFQSGGSMPYARSGTGTVGRMIFYPSGTKLLFPQAAPPTGWTLDTDVTDHVIMVNDTAGAGTGGNWTLSGMAVDGHALTIDEMPAHTHVFRNAGFSVRAPGSGGGQEATSEADDDTSSTGGGSSHTHGLTNTSWRPSYLNVVKATLD